MKANLQARVVGVIVSLFLFSAAAIGQSTFGSITGTVRDPSGAVVPGASVTVINQGTAGVRHTTTGSTGDFTVPALDVGAYHLRIEAKGFNVYDRANLNLTANQVLDLNVDLVLGSTATVTQVTASTPAINTSNAQNGSVVSNQALNKLPLVSRQHADAGVYDFILLTPGSAQVPDNGAGPVVSGTQQASGQLVAIDGMSMLRNTSGFGAGEEQPSFEAVQELNLITSNAPAEFAAAVAAVEVTRGGTNQFHGTAFETYNGQKLNAVDFFATGLPKAKRVYNDFGGSVGGPIKKDKTFFYFDYEGSRTGSKRLLTADVPLPAWTQGDFSGVSTPIIDPTTGAQFPGNIIPPDRISKVSQNIQSTLYPAPNTGTPGSVAQNFKQQFPGVGTTVWNVFDGRFDYNMSSKDTIFARFDTRRVPQDYTDDLPSIGHEFQVRNGFNAVAAWTHIFTPTLLNEFRAGYDRGRNFYFPLVVGSDLIQQWGIQGVTSTGLHNVPIVDITGVTPADMDAECDSFQDHLEQGYEYIDNISWTKGAHSMKFGFNAIRDQLIGARVSGNIYGQYSFSGVYTGMGYADFLLGIPQTTTLGLATPYNYVFGWTTGLYAQDDYKITSKLTLNYGARWDIQPPYHDKFGAIYTFDPQNGELVIPDNGTSRVNPLFPSNIPVTTASQAGIPNNTLIHSHDFRVVPRLGFAYTPSRNGKTVIRGGYGIYSNLIYSGIPTHLSGGPFAGSQTYVNSITNGVPLFAFPDPFLTSGTTSSQNVVGVNPNLKTPYTQQWNLTVEHQIANIGLRVSYVGTHTVDLIYQSNLNQPPPSTTAFSTSERTYPLYHNITWYDTGGTDDYHSLQLSVSRNYGHNLEFSGGYTWQRDLTDVCNSTSIRGCLVTNRFDRRADRGNNVDVPDQRAYGYAIYTLPFGRGQRFLTSPNPFLQGVLGGWQTAMNIAIQSGEFYNPTFDGFDPSNTNTFGGRPDRIGSGILSNPSVTGWFNAAAFKIPGCPDTDPLCGSPANVGRFGNAGYDILAGPGLVNFDFALSKTVQFKERYRMTFRASAVNVINHPNFYQPDADISDGPGVTGTISGTTSANGLGEPTGREIDLTLRFEF